MPLDEFNDWRRHLAREALRTDDEAGQVVLGLLALLATAGAFGIAMVLAHAFGA